MTDLLTLLSVQSGEVTGYETSESICYLQQLDSFKLRMNVSRSSVVFVSKYIKYRSFHFPTTHVGESDNSDIPTVTPTLVFRFPAQTPRRPPSPHRAPGP